MIVQTAPEGDPSFVITMAQHTALAGRFAREFGNDRFEPVSPRDEMLYVIDNHDAGWADLDSRAPCDPETGLPYNLVSTPFDMIVKTSVGSPDFNSKRHAYCGLISSMHSWGLYNGRYGMSDQVLLDSLAVDNREKADAMLGGELARQNRLKEELAQDPEAADWAEEANLFQNYKQLQFFDTLALYFNRTHDAARGPNTFTHVPMSATEDTDITIEREGPDVYRLSPFPFREDSAEFWFEGRYMSPLESGDESGAALEAAPVDRQSISLIAG